MCPINLLYTYTHTHIPYMHKNIEKSFINLKSCNQIIKIFPPIIFYAVNKKFKLNKKFYSNKNCTCVNKCTTHK